jgi:hypothetical protein
MPLSQLNSADKHHSTTTSNYILAHNLQIQFKEGFYKRIGHAASVKIHQNIEEF